MTGGRGTYTDLAERFGTGAAMGVIGLGVTWLGGGYFTLFVAVIAGVLVWEVVTMLGGARSRAMALGLLAAGLMVLSWLLPPAAGLPLLLLAAIAGLAALDHNRAIYLITTALIMVAGYGLLMVREDFGVVWMTWLILVVGATDVLGYFVGRAIGGPKFWPRVSPKKTWSGTVAGWVGAGAIGALFALMTVAGAEVIGLSVALSMASQIGDVAESAMKRKMGVKDSSGLLPGHGGVFDRFDGMLGAALMLLLVASVVPFPPVPVS